MSNKSLVVVNRDEYLPSVKVQKNQSGEIETAESFGIEAIIEGRPGRMSIIVPQRSKTPISRHKQYFPIADYQREIKVRCYKGENDLTAKNTKLGEFVISGLLPRLKKDAQGVTITFTINESGVILVDAVEIENPENHLKVKLDYIDARQGLARGIAQGLLREVVGMFLPSGKRK